MLLLIIVLYLSLIIHVSSFQNILSIRNRWIQQKQRSTIEIYQYKSSFVPPIKLPDLSQKEFPIIPEENNLGCNYDLVVIGSGPGGEAAAVQAAKLGVRVAIIEKKSAFGGPTGLTSKAVREATKRICNAIEQIGGDIRKQIGGLWKRKFPALRAEAEVYQVKETRDRLAKNNIDLFIGEATFVDTFNISPAYQQGSVVRVCRPTECVGLKAQYVCVATGSRPHKPDFYSPEISLNFSSSRIITSTEIGNLNEVPKAVVILGGGTIAVEYATVLSKLGVGVSLVCKDKEFLPFLEPELREALKRRMRRNHVLFVPEDIKSIEIDPVNQAFVTVALHSLPELKHKENTLTNNNSTERPRLKRVDRKLKVDLVLYSAGRDANSEGLGLEAVQCDIGKYGRIVIDQHHRTTAVSEVFAIGDVIGPPGLASAAQQQARAVANHLFSKSSKSAVKTSEAVNTERDSSENDGDNLDWFESGGDDFFVDQSDSREVTSGVADESTEVSGTLFGESPVDTASVSGSHASVAGGGKRLISASNSVPITLWTIPELATVGLSKQQAARQVGAGDSSRFVEGYGYFKDMARGRLSGDMDGFLKVVIDSDSGASDSASNNSNSVHKSKRGHKIIGVFIFGEGANELIQLGSVLVNSGATAEQVSNTPFAAVTLCGLFQIACDDALSKLPSTRR